MPFILKGRIDSDNQFVMGGSFKKYRTVVLQKSKNIKKHLLKQKCLDSYIFERASVLEPVPVRPQSQGGA